MDLVLHVVLMLTVVLWMVVLNPTNLTVKLDSVQAQSSVHPMHSVLHSTLLHLTVTSMDLVSPV
jgi:hypothetical protein